MEAAVTFSIGIFIKTKMMGLKKIILFFIAVCMQLICLAQIQHVEPLNWWVGMKDTALQLLINGNAVGNATPVPSRSGRFRDLSD